MRALAVLALFLLLPASALAQHTTRVTATKDNTPVLFTLAGQLTTAPAPVLSTEGMSLEGLSGFQVVLSAASGQTLSGAGALRAYFYVPALGRWVRNKDLDLAVGVSGVRDATWAQSAVAVPYSRFLYVPEGVTVSAGLLDMLVIGWLR